MEGHKVSQSVPEFQGLELIFFTLCDERLLTCLLLSFFYRKYEPAAPWFNLLDVEIRSGSSCFLDYNNSQRMSWISQSLTSASCSWTGMFSWWQQTFTTTPTPQPPLSHLPQHHLHLSTQYSEGHGGSVNVWPWLHSFCFALEQTWL